MTERVIYLDNAATTFPKPHEVLAEMLKIYETQGVSPGRGSYDLSVEAKGMDPEQVSATLDGDFGIASRAGLHCAPLVHQDLGTSPLGGVRFSLVCFNTLEEIDQVVAAMASISRF